MVLDGDADVRTVRKVKCDEGEDLARVDDNRFGWSS